MRLDFDSETFVTFAATDYESGAFDRVEQAAPLTTSADRTRAAPILAFSAKDHGADVQENLSPTLRAGGHSESHANAGVMPAVAWAIGSHAGAADGDQTNRSHAAGGPVGSNISEGLAYSLRGGRTQNVGTAMQVRRLTPVECARLQGFPDHYLDITYRGKPASDGPKYRAIGNSWAVPVITWIGRRIEQIVGTSTQGARRAA